MNFKSFSVGLALAVSSVFLSNGAIALPVVNSSFEILPPGGLPFGCGTACSYSEDVIPGWINTGTSGQFQPGSASGNFAYFNSVPDGLTVAYSNGGTISQAVGTATAGVTYILQVDVGARNDGFHAPATVDLMIGANDHFAVGIYPTDGNWATYTLSYTATLADQGALMSIVLGTPFAQGDWDNVRLSAVPEASTWGMMLIGFASVGFVAYRRKSGSALRVA
jgi:hypothetical protein